MIFCCNSQVSQPQYFKGWNDKSDRQIDTYPKLTYPIMMLAAEDLHFRCVPTIPIRRMCIIINYFIFW